MNMHVERADDSGRQRNNIRVLVGWTGLRMYRFGPKIDTDWVCGRGGAIMALEVKPKLAPIVDVPITLLWRNRALTGATAR